MRRVLAVLFVSSLALSFGSTRAVAQDAPNVDQLRKERDDALNQLKAAQDRKNELASENEKLNVKIADLQKQLDASTKSLNDLRAQAATFASQTYDLRAEQAAWLAFVQQFPKLEARWDAFLRTNVFSAPKTLPILDQNP